MEHAQTFERPIEEAELQVRRLAWRLRAGRFDAAADYAAAYRRREELRRSLYAGLTAWERVQLARHPERPHGLAAAEWLFGRLQPLRGDRGVEDDAAIVAGIGRWRNRPVGVIACERGRGKREARQRNFGMPGPAGFRKAVRTLEFAERLAMPVVSLVDTPGAYPGVDSERFCIAEAISRLLWQQARVRTPTLGVVLGEGGSGGALALAMADRIVAMQFAYFSVISPEACASILWRDGAKTPLAAEALRLLPEDLLALGIADEIVAEPDGGAHRYPHEALCMLREVVDRRLQQLTHIPVDRLCRERAQRYRGFGQVYEDSGNARSAS